MNAGFLLSFALSIKKELTLAGEHTIYNFTVLALRFNLRRIHFHAIVLRCLTFNMSDSGTPIFAENSTDAASGGPTRQSTVTFSNGLQMMQ